MAWGSHFHNNIYWGDRSFLKQLSKGELESWFKNLLSFLKMAAPYSHPHPPKGISFFKTTSSIFKVKDHGILQRSDVEFGTVTDSVIKINSKDRIKGKTSQFCWMNLDMQIQKNPCNLNFEAK